MAADTTTETAVDWSSADVVDARLTVAFTSKPTATWTKCLTDVVERLERSGRGWGEIKVTRKTLRVAAVTPGAEEALRHFLESALLQVNADTEADDSDDHPAPEQDRSEADEQMTETFRAFADSSR